MNVVEEARRVAARLAANAAEDDRMRRLSDPTWKLLLDGGFLRALQPARFGGGEVSLVEFVDAAIELSRASSSAGWVAGVIGVHPWQLALFPDKAQQEMWDENPTTMHSSSYNPTGKAEKVAGGYKVSGRWSFSSGCDHCRGVMLGAICGSRGIGGNQVRDFRSLLLMRDQYRIEDNWHVAGLKGTGSKDIVVEETFVPDYRTQSHLDYATNRRCPDKRSIRGRSTECRGRWCSTWRWPHRRSALRADSSMRGRQHRASAGSVRSTGRGRRDSSAASCRSGLVPRCFVARMRADAIELWQMAEAGEPASMQIARRCAGT